MTPSYPTRSCCDLHASTEASGIVPRIVMKPHSMMCLLSPLDTGSTGGGGEGCMGTWATIVRAGDADGRYQSFDPPCGEAIGRWQRAALAEGPLARCCPHPPPSTTVVPLRIASRQGGSEWELATPKRMGGLRHR